ncbi:hypothetical protein GCM10010910_17650 [Microbacterium nanhaiense]|uniref:Uncharacterized protein n=1 Tax=Microbacterium nanhaiense TaxID=1301026 RepID=A0ABQ2N1R6_9MICO|nr:hypothetical protein [Microbacterium nanhaiense]GGO63951.1 hypothetical protein GCM10010910_17650 [Microbacterium nanhaiense]
MRDEYDEIARTALAIGARFLPTEIVASIEMDLNSGEPGVALLQILEHLEEGGHDIALIYTPQQRAQFRKFEDEPETIGSAIVWALDDAENTPPSR